MRNAAALLAGLLFGLGLTISQMVNPQKVIGFLDVTGDWDPSLALVLFGAVAVSTVGYRLVSGLQRPLLADRFRLPTRNDLDARLIGGAAVFGIGWGLAGYCPGPAVSALATGSAEPLLFVAAMAAGSTVHWLLERRAGRQT